MARRLVAGIHVLTASHIKDMDGRGHRRAKLPATATVTIPSGWREVKGDIELA